ncbi:hypothetical protein K1X22_05680 [Mycolicibacterium farcinogenes]|uniref:hypothetical protein n=1 Tax=Mycolicibacterium farcinogenes TaxID=1802 RepID=UPI001C8D5D03|nr:hypothetical protein [Mycolicibacterium farcinogenes]QZH61249.1 hypothetical protein K1X22_05680 [Mycolicibacterium farcinogenes]
MPATAHHITRPVIELLADWFPLRDELCDLRSQDHLTPAQEERVRDLLTELVDIADDIVGHLVPDHATRCQITGRAPC